jgi:hypothetical protein
MGVAADPADRDDDDEDTEAVNRGAGEDKDGKCRAGVEKHAFCENVCHAYEVGDERTEVVISGAGEDKCRKCRAGDGKHVSCVAASEVGVTAGRDNDDEVDEAVNPGAGADEGQAGLEKHAVGENERHDLAVAADEVGVASPASSRCILPGFCNSCSARCIRLVSIVGSESTSGSVTAAPPVPGMLGALSPRPDAAIDICAEDTSSESESGNVAGAAAEPRVGC